jgi:hypothetical protein
MPISVPKQFRAHLVEAAKTAAAGAAFGAGQDVYRRIVDHLRSKNVPHQVHDHKSKVPSDHSYWEPD